MEKSLLEFWNENDIARIWISGTAMPAGNTYHHNTSDDGEYCDLSELLESGLFACPEDGSHPWHDLIGTVQKDGSWIWNGTAKITDTQGNDYTQMQFFLSK